MLVAMNRIAEYVHGRAFDEFVSDYKTVDAVIRNFEVIGEASNKLSAEFRERYPDMPWAEMYLLRNKISHEYFGIDYEIIWDLITNHLPVNRKRIEEILSSLD